ncbi:MAG: sulfatase [Paenibacillaceae bacterium]|nr:sulfatase [Paenibacillaceae bacterium]
MKAIMLMFDSLNRHMLPPYGCDWVHAPNFQRLAERAVTFTSCYSGSLPCMPARRELHTGRYNFLHRAWGPLEPYDDSMPELLKQHGVYTHLITDHHHYFEDGGGTYHPRYTTWEFVRGQEYDAWKGEVLDPDVPELLGAQNINRKRQYWVNRKYMANEEEHTQVQTFQLGMEFLRKNHNQDHWFLQLEAFDPHEPFFAPQRFRDLYPNEYDGPHYDWPKYGRADDDEHELQHIRYQYAALVSMCDEQLGKVLDLMDECRLWDDTMLIVNTDHGFFLGEKGWRGKMVMPFYNELVHIPLFIWDPRTGKRNERNDCLVQTVDLAPTLLDYFQVEIPADAAGKPLKRVISHGEPVREAGLFGMFGDYVNCTDGRYVYMRAPVAANEPLFNYTVMATHIRNRFTIEELRNTQISPGFVNTKGCPVMKVKSLSGRKKFKTVLFDLEQDPEQESPIDDQAAEQRMIRLMIQLMKENDAPSEQYERLGLTEYLSK